MIETFKKLSYERKLREKQSTKLKKKPATTIMKKEKKLGVEFVCLRHEISTKKSLTVFEATELYCSKVF